MIYLKIHSQGTLWQQIDFDIWNRHTLPGHQIWKIRQYFHENGLSYSKSKILGYTPLVMTWMEDFHCLIGNSTIHYNLIFVVGSDCFNSTEYFLLNCIFLCTARTSQCEWIMLKLLFHVLGTHSVWVGQICPHHQLFRSYLHTNKILPLITLDHMSLFWHCTWEFAELCQVLLETSCYHDTLAMNI